jgi:hypothetical protein
MCGFSTKAKTNMAENLERKRDINVGRNGKEKRRKTGREKQGKERRIREREGRKYRRE